METNEQWMEQFLTIFFQSCEILQIRTILLTIMMKMNRIGIDSSGKEFCLGSQKKRKKN